MTSSQAPRESLRTAQTPPLLTPQEPAPFVLHNAQAGGCGLLVCDHASNRVPQALDNLGLAAAMLQGHIAWDPGAAGVARVLAEELDLPLIEAGYSRLAVDCNRPPDSPSCMPAISDGVLIPANLGLDAAARTQRLQALFWPYHDAIAERLQALETDGRVPLMISVHSFTPSMHRIARRMQVGILWDRDPRIPLPLLAALRADGIGVGDNEPYSGRHPADFTIDHHAERERRACASIEIRQDLIADEAGQLHWAQRLARCLRSILADPGLYARRPNTRTPAGRGPRDASS